MAHGNTGRDGILFDGTVDNRPRAHDRAAPYSHGVQHYHVLSQIDIVADDDRPRLTALVDYQLVGVAELMLIGNDSDSGREENIVTQLDAGVAEDLRPGADVGMVADLDVARSASWGMM